MLAGSNASPVAVAIIDRYPWALEERLQDVQERIRDLRQIREALLRDLGGTLGGETGCDANGSEHWAIADRRRPRARMLREWLTANGPATRQAIRDNTGLPYATIQTYLSPKFGFVMVGRGLWDVIRQGTVGDPVPREESAEIPTEESPGSC